MKVTMLTTACGPTAHHLAGHTYDLPDEVAQAYLEGGYARAADAVHRGPVVAMAVVQPAETADARPRPARGRK